MQLSLTEVIPSPHLHRSPTPGVPPPKTRSPSPAFLRKTKLLANVFVPKSYTVEAVCALPHPVPTHSLASSLCMTHMITGSEDGYIRNYDIFSGLNGKNFLTAPQRHHCGVVEGLLKYAPLRYWWENPIDLKREDSSEEPALSPVYSLLMHSDALWSLAGTHVSYSFM
jgi:transcriptional activator SPT8